MQSENRYNAIVVCQTGNLVGTISSLKIVLSELQFALVNMEIVI